MPFKMRWQKRAQRLCNCASSDRLFDNAHWVVNRHENRASADRAYARRMNEKINNILAQMAALEADLRSAVHEQESHVLFTIKGKRVEFERSVHKAHRKLKKNFLRWLVTNRP